MEVEEKLRFMICVEVSEKLLLLGVLGCIKEDEIADASAGF